MKTTYREINESEIGNEKGKKEQRALRQLEYDFYLLN